MGGPSASPVHVRYAVIRGSGDTATPGVDFVAQTGELVFNQTFTPALTGTVHALPIRILGDAVKEPTETFTVRLLNATGATIDPARSVTIARIFDGSPATPISVSVNNAGAIEGDTVATCCTLLDSNYVDLFLTLSRPVPPGSPVKVVYDTVARTATGGSVPGTGADFGSIAPTTITFSTGDDGERQSMISRM